MSGSTSCGRQPGQKRAGEQGQDGVSSVGMSRHGVTHTNVFPRLGIGADFTRLGLHGTVVMNNVLTDWGEGRRSEP